MAFLRMWRCVVVLVSCMLSVAIAKQAKEQAKEQEQVQARPKPKNPLADGGTTISFGDNMESEEEKTSKSMPDRADLRCDACSLIMQNLAGALVHAESLRKRPLAESQIDATLNYVCQPGLDEIGIYTNIPGPDGKDTSRLMVPGRWKTGPDLPMRYSAMSDKWRDRLRAACKKMLEMIGEEEFYELYKKHVPAPSKKEVKVDLEETFAPAEAFIRGVCMKSDDDEEEPATTKKKKKKSRSSQDVRNSCEGTAPGHMDDGFFFDMAGWKEVVKKTKADVGKVEL